MAYQDRYVRGMWAAPEATFLYLVTDAKTHGDGFGMINGKKAFTLIELLVVLVIIGILTGLLLSAIAKAKGAATIAQCHNYRRQLTIYYFAAHDEQDYYDPSYKDIAMFNVRRELMPSHSIIQRKCYDCHPSVSMK